MKYTLFPRKAIILPPEHQSDWRGKTLTYAAQQAKPGDTIYVMGGNYEEQSLVPTRSGTADRPIRFLRYGHDSVLINGDGWMETGIDVRDRNHIHFRGFSLYHYTSHPVRIRGGEGIRLEGFTVIDDANIGGVAVEDSSDFQFRHNQIIATNTEGLRLERCLNATLLGNILGTLFRR